MPMRPLLQKFCCLLVIAATLLSPSAAPAAIFGEFTLKKEKELGDRFNVLVRSRLPLVEDTEIVNYINSVVQRLSHSMPPQPFPFTVSVIRHNAVNAFATPGGYIFVHTGLILAMENEAQVAGVIAHEMAHVTQRHIARRIENSQVVSILSLIGALAGAFLGGEGGSAALVGSMAAGQAAMLNYSRDDEREADQVGMNFLTKAGYPPQGMPGAFEVLGRKQWMMGTTIPTYRSTHPALDDRVKDMEIRVGRLSADRQAQKGDNARFLRVQALVRARYSDPQPAVQAFSKQMNGPQRCTALMGMGILSARQNKVNDAIRWFDDAMACAPNDQLIVREAGRFHYTKGNKVRASNLLQRAVAMNRNDIIALFYHARDLGDLGHFDEAVRYTREVLRKTPENADVHEFLARLYGRDRKLFSANLHMAYSGLYANDERKVRQFLEKAKPLVQGAADKSALDQFERQYKERKEFWK